MASRSLQDLVSELAEKARVVEQSFRMKTGHDWLCYCTYRSLEEQARLYRQGHTSAQVQAKAMEFERAGRPDLAQVLIRVGPQPKGPNVTNAGPGQSAHNYRKAFDAVPLVGGKAMWGTSSALEKRLWQAYGEAVEAAGLEWAGRWRSFKEFPARAGGRVRLEEGGGVMSGVQALAKLAKARGMKRATSPFARMRAARASARNATAWEARALSPSALAARQLVKMRAGARRLI